MALCLCYCCLAFTHTFFFRCSFSLRSAVCMSVPVFAYFLYMCVFVFVGVHGRVYVKTPVSVCTLYAGNVYVRACSGSVCVTHVRVCGGASVNGIVSKWQRGSRENDSHVCGLITINSPFDCN